jgi:hypothetical protein
MKNRILSGMDTLKRKMGIAILCGALILTMGSGMAFAASAASVKDKKYAEESSITYAEESCIMITDNDGNVEYSNDEGETWQPYDTSNMTDLEPYTVAEYEIFIADFKAAAPDLIASGTLTQEQIDETIAIMEDDLVKLKEDNGKGNYVIYKPILESTWEDENGDTWGSGIYMCQTFDDTAIEIETAYVSTVVSDGKISDIGSFNSKEELLSAMKAYCDTEIQAGRMSQDEADAVLEQFR